MSFLSNRAAVHFEKGDFQQCIKDCDAGESNTCMHCLCCHACCLAYGGALKQRIKDCDAREARLGLRVFSVALGGRTLLLAHPHTLVPLTLSSIAAINLALSFVPSYS